MQTEIREMIKADWEDISRIYKQGVEEGKATFQTQCPDYDEWDEKHIAKCRYVISYDGRIAGWAAISPTSSRPFFSGVVEVSIYMDREYRGMGLGVRLLSHLCDMTEREGFWCLYSSIFPFNTASLAIHKKCGFREIGYREKIAKDRFGVWQDTVLLERRNAIV